jgi:hypothetical protein
VGVPGRKHRSTRSSPPRIQRELPALAQWRKADTAIADALAAAGGPDSGTTLERLRVALAEQTERLQAVDRTLGPLHTAYITARSEALAIRNPSAQAI